jgi:imidazole glycerol-phosphate synthase subunit HisH
VRDGSAHGEDAAEHEGAAVIALVDYGAGNLTSVRKALAALGAEFRTPSSAADLAAARGIIVPGVGHFAATRALDERWRGAIRAAVERGASLFGICLGMQWLFEGSSEAPEVRGLGVLAGTCGRLPESGTQKREIDPTPLLKVPHVGWNRLAIARTSTLLDGVADGAQVYFTHSYVAPVTPDAVAVTTYGQPFTSAVEQGRIAGVQFHPEKSGDVGLRILRNWLGAVGQP